MTKEVPGISLSPWMLMVSFVGLMAIVTATIVISEEWKQPEKKPDVPTEQSRGLHAMEMTPEEFRQFKRSEASFFYNAIKVQADAFAIEDKTPERTHCILNTALDAATPPEVMAYYLHGTLPPLTYAKIEKNCVTTYAPVATVAAAAQKEAVHESTEEERYAALQKLQANCIKSMEYYNGMMDVRMRNFCACVATKQLATMPVDDVKAYNMTKQMPKGLPNFEQVREQCSSLWYRPR